MREILTKAPEIVKRVEKGILMKVEGFDYPIVQVYGTPYEMGHAQGELLKEEINDLIPVFYQFIVDTVSESFLDFFDFIPEWIIKKLLRLVLPYFLDLYHLFAKSYITQDYYEEMRGLQDGTGIEAKEFMRLALLPEAAGMHCSMLGANGNATQEINGTMIQLRTLGKKQMVDSNN